MSEVGERPTVPWNGNGEIPSALARARAMGRSAPDPATTSGITITVNEDGSVSFGDIAAPAVRRNRKGNFNENLALTMSDGALSSLSHEVLDAVEADKLSRSAFIANYNKGIDLLGLKIEDGSSARGSRQSISRVKNPALLKACMRSQSLGRGQLLPADGPVKVQTISGSTAAEDELARNFELDFNYYMTDVAREYYPDTDRALFYRAFGGSMYKKIDRCPLRRRPVSESVPLEYFIVSEDATDHHNARKTHESVLNRATMMRMQRFGDWRDIELVQPMANDNPARRKILEQMGLSAVRTRPQDMDFTVYQTYQMMDATDYGFEDAYAEEGLPVPYKITVDKDSQQILAVNRNWRDGDDLFRERQVFVKYGLVPGLGFLDYGYLHLIGNQTRVLTAIWQILVDSGMLKNFPAGMKVKGIRTLTNEINPGLGEWAEVDIGNMKDIRAAFMGLPYGEVGQPFIELLRDLQADVDKMSGTLELEMGTNRTNMPVGTILAMIEQQAQDITAVHQRDHRAQKEELRLIRDCFVDHPEDLRWLQRKGSGRNWQELVEEFANMDLVPASDPNVPSQAHRIMINQFLMQVAQAAPMLFGSRIRDVAKRVLSSAGIRDADTLLAPAAEIAKAQAAQAQGAQGGPGAGAGAAAKAQLELPLKQAQLAIEAQKLQLEAQENQREAADQAAEHQQRDEDQQQKAEKDAADTELAQAKLASEHVTKLATAALDNAPTAEDDANLRNLNARSFAAMGTGAQGFAKAAETVQQGKQDLAGLDADLGDEGKVLPQAPARRTTRNRKGGRAK